MNEPSGGSAPPHLAVEQLAFSTLISKYSCFALFSPLASLRLFSSSSSHFLPLLWPRLTFLHLPSALFSTILLPFPECFCCLLHPPLKLIVSGDECSLLINIGGDIQYYTILLYYFFFSFSPPTSKLIYPEEETPVLNCQTCTEEPGTRFPFSRRALEGN